MVHISEVANSFVSDIKEFLKEGDTVRVKVINVDDAGRINLSIKRAQENSQQSAVRTGGTEQRRAPRPRTGQFQGGGRTAQSKQPRDPATMTFEDKLKMFMADSESRMADIRHKTDARAGRAAVNNRCASVLPRISPGRLLWRFCMYKKIASL